MANQKHVKILKKGAKAWNARREENPKIRLDLVNADLREADLVGADLRGADLGKVDLGGSRWRGVPNKGNNPEMFRMRRDGPLEWAQKQKNPPALPLKRRFGYYSTELRALQGNIG
tara:strand:- start:644 stop:991 length:348 start_codon:yes stop_codon:yes gene_type:complete